MTTWRNIDYLFWLGLAAIGAGVGSLLVLLWFS